MTSYKPFNNLETQHESSQVNIDLGDNILPPIDILKRTLTTKWVLCLGFLQIFCAIGPLLVGFLWFTLVAGICGLVIFLVGAYPYRGNQILLVLASIASFVASIFLLIYSHSIREEHIGRYVILIMSGVVECLVSVATFIMASRDAGCCGCVVSPNTNVVYFKRGKIKNEQPYFTHGPTTVFPQSINSTANPLTTFTSIGSIFRSNRASNPTSFQDDHQYGAAQYGPSPPPYLDTSSSSNVFDENANTKGI